MGGLSSLLMGIAGPMAKQVLISLGIGLVTFAGLDAAVSAALSAAQSNLSGLHVDAAAIMARGGIFTGMSVIAGGITAGVSMIAMKRLGAI